MIFRSVVVFLLRNSTSFETWNDSIDEYTVNTVSINKYFREYRLLQNDIKIKKSRFYNNSSIVNYTKLIILLIFITILY